MDPNSKEGRRLIDRAVRRGERVAEPSLQPATAAAAQRIARLRWVPPIAIVANLLAIILWLSDGFQDDDRWFVLPSVLVLFVLLLTTVQGWSAARAVRLNSVD